MSSDDLGLSKDERGLSISLVELVLSLMVTGGIGDMVTLWVDSEGN